jgi:hypothetical protein
VGLPPRGTSPLTIVTSSASGLRSLPRRIVSGCVSRTTEEISDRRGGKVFGRQMHGVLSEQNPQPSLRPSRRELGDILVNEEVKSISIGNESGEGASGVGRI